MVLGKYSTAWPATYTCRCHLVSHKQTAVCQPVKHEKLAVFQTPLLRV